MSFNYTIPDGVPAWVKLRVANHVELRSTAHADRPILVDRSPPIAGVVYDGPDHHRDLQYQASSTTICAAWKDFYDPESGIYRYMVCVGTGGQQDNVVAMEVVDAHTTVRCWDRQLEHGRRYYTTVTAFHGGHDMLNVTARSSGVLVDMTPPVAGTAKDGPADQPDVRFSSEAAVASVSWHGFHDPESGIHSYQVTFLRTHAGDTKEGIVHTDTISSDTSQLEVHHLHLHHGDRVRAVVMATNGAGSTCQASSSGFTVDLTAPNMHELSDGPTPGRNIHFTASLTTLSATWNYTDAESDVDKMKLAVYETKGGTSSRIHPTSTQWHELPGTSGGWTNERPFQLELGLHYHFQVAAVNGAGLTGVHQTDGVTVDNTPPEMLYVHAGAINGESEELDDGFVVHNEEEGIWGSWAGRDFESGIEKYLVALGTQPGGTDLLDFTDVGEKRSHYMTGFRFSLTNPVTNTPVYYISVKCVSGADQVSSVLNSSPIKVVEGDKTGVVYDGPNKAADVDFTLDGSTATVSFRGFQSARDGIASYLWAVGTLPYGDDVMAFTGYGIVRDMAEPDDASQQVHYGQVMLPLESGTTYYATVRALTGAGNVLESCSNGVTPDNSPPKAQFRQVGPEATEITDDVVYQTETDSLSASWNVTDPESGVTSVHVHHGSYPGEEMVSGKSKSYKAVDQIENSAMTPITSGVANVLTLQASNKVGLDVTIVSPPVVVDQTPPEDGSLQCPVFISGAVELTCTWLGFGDAESGLGHYRIGMGRYQGDDSVAAYINVPLSRQHFTFPDVKSLNLTHEQTYYISVVAVNKVGLQSVGASVPVVVDDTPPEGGGVIEISDSSALGDTITTTGQLPTGLTDKDAVCQRSLTQVTVAFEPFVDRESGIDRYEIAVGTSPGGAQIHDFTRISRGQHQITLTGLDMTHVIQAFVTVKGYNGAGHYSIATSNGVYISRISAGLEPLVASYVYDGTTRGKDLNYQDHNDGLSAHWDLRGDPCPVRSLRWAALRADKQYVVPFSPLQNDATEVAADELQLTDSKTYYVTIRVTNVLGYTYSLRSNGVTVQVEPLLPGIVRDGDIMGVDLSFQPSLTTLSANWDRFGRDYHVDNRGDMDTEIGYHQRIDHYEVAAGTDRRFPDTRDNVRPFTNVGLNKTWTFTDLTLIPGSVTYYMTVRAYSVSTSMVEVTSTGIQAGSGAAVITRGQIIVQRYVPSTSEVSISWRNFLFVHPIIRYQWAIGTYTEEVHNVSCMHLEHDKLSHERGVGNYSHLFDVQTLTSADTDTYVRAKGLAMAHGRTYHAVVIAVDQTGGCMMEGATFTVDTTPPLEGSLSTGADFGKNVNFLRDSSQVEVSWRDFRDAESGIVSYEVTLLEGDGCRPPQLNPTLMDTFILMPVNATSHKFMELQLKPNSSYFVYLRVTNGAKMSTTKVSKTLLLDLQAPTAGVVIDGSDIRRDRKFQSSLTQVTGTLLYLPTPEGLACPLRIYPMTAPHPDLAGVETLGINGDKHQPIVYNRNLLRYDSELGTAFNLQRDGRAARWMASAMDTWAHLAAGGTYQFQLKAGSGAIRSVTSVTIRNGPRGVVWDYRNETVMALPDNPDSIVIPDNLPRDTDGKQKFSWDRLDGFGLQIISNQTTSEAAVLFAWMKNKNETYTDVAELKFDPSLDFHHYRVVINEKEPNPYPTDWTLTVYVDDEVMVYMTGVPSDLPPDAVFQLQLWSDTDWIPDVDDVFNVPNTTAFVKDLQLPGDSELPCRYVSPFRGGHSPVAAIYAGIGSDKLRDDIVPFRRVASPCTPCAVPCLECSPTCQETATSTIQMVLDGLSLPRPSDNVNDTLPIYYLTTQAVTGSGQVALASSNGFYIDVTPPEIEMIFHVDMAFSRQRPSMYQGSNSTIMIVWRARDYQSEIVEYQWAIGTTPRGTDIQPFVSVGTNKFGFNNELEGILEDNTTYYATLRAVNEAGLVQTNVSSGVTVLLAGPDESNTETSVPGAQPLNGTSKAVRSDRQDRVSVVYDAPKTEKVDGVFFSLGTRNQSSSDIFPSSQVGYNISGTVDVDAGGLHLYGRKVANVSDARDRTGRTKRQANSQFFMEPGRSIYIGMEVCAVNHKCGFMNNKAVLVMRDEDVLATVSDDGHIETRLKLESSGTVSIKNDFGQADNTTFVAGILSASDMQDIYGSAASNTFRSYIVDPDGSEHQTDRNLYRRILKWTPTSFYLTALPGQSVAGPIQFSVPFNVTTFPSTVMRDQQPRLLVWKNELSQWKDTSQTCNEKWRKLEYNRDKATFVVNFCEDTSETPRFTGPRQFTVAGVSTTFVNSPPVLTSRQAYTMRKNSGTLQAKMAAVDPDGDAIYFILDADQVLPLRGNATVTTSGLLSYRPCPFCAGNETVHVTIKERREDGEVPLVTRAAITIVIQPVNTSPFVLLANQSGLLYTPEEEGHVEWLVEQNVPYNIRDSYLVGLFGGYDMDGLDGLRFLVQPPSKGSIRLLSEVGEHLVYPETCSNMTHSMRNYIESIKTGHNASLLLPCKLTRQMPSGSIGMIASVIEYTPLRWHSGKDEFKVVVQDAQRDNSSVHTVVIYILENLCQNRGECKGPEWDPNCASTQRATKGFEGYGCLCAPGFTGHLCETNIDECASSPCPSNYTCLDGINKYTCHCAPGWPCNFAPPAPLPNYWWFAVVVPACLVTAVVIVIVLLKFRPDKAKLTKVEPMNVDSKDTMQGQPVRMSRQQSAKVKRNQVAPLPETTDNLEMMTLPPMALDATLTKAVAGATSAQVFQKEDVEVYHLPVTQTKPGEIPSGKVKAAWDKAEDVGKMAAQSEC